MKKTRTNSSLEKLLLDNIENKYKFIIQAAQAIKEQQKKLGKEMSREEIIKKTLYEIVPK